MATAGKFAGRITKLAISTDGGSTYNDLNGIVDVTFNPDRKLIPSTTHDDGEWETNIYGRMSGTVEASCRRDENDTAQNALLDAAFAATNVNVRFRHRGDNSGDEEITGSAKVTVTPLSGPNDDMADVNFTIPLSGTITRGTQ